MTPANDNTAVKNVIYASFARSAGIVGNAVVGEVQVDESDPALVQNDVKGLKAVSQSLSGLHDIVYATLGTLQSRSLLDQYISDDKLRVQAENTRETATAVPLPPVSNAEAISGGGEESMLLSAFGMLNERISEYAEGMAALKDALDQKAQCISRPDIDIKRGRGKGGLVSSLLGLTDEALDVANVATSEADKKTTNGKSQTRRGSKPTMGPSAKTGLAQGAGSRMSRLAGGLMTSPLTARMGMMAPMAMMAAPMLGGLVAGAMSLGSSIWGGIKSAFTGGSSMGVVEMQNRGGSFGGAGASSSWNVPQSDPNDRGNFQFDPSQLQTGKDYEGLRIKSQESIAGGAASEATIMFAKLVQSNIPGINRFTAFNDEFHQGRRSKYPNSPHLSGMAFDVTIDKPGQAAATKRQIEQLANAYGFQVSVGDEYNNPVSWATGGHIHVTVRGANKQAIATAQNNAQFAKAFGKPPSLKGIDPVWIEALTKQPPQKKKQINVLVPPADPTLYRSSGPGPIIKGQSGGQTRNIREQYAAHFR